MESKNIIPIEILHSCPNCGSRKTRHWAYATDLLLSTTTQNFEYSRCQGCGVIYLKTRPLETALDLVYPEDYHPYSAAKAFMDPVRRERALVRWARSIFPSVFDRMRKKFDDRVLTYYDCLRSGDTFLDFGSGSGMFLDSMREKGLRTIGMDFSDFALEGIQTRRHIAVPATESGWASIENNSIDFVRMNHVAEHLYHPAAVFESIKRVMKSNAILHVAIPNPKGISARLFRRYWHALDCPRHMILYPPQTFNSYLESLGYAVREVILEPITKDHIRSWGYLLSGVGHVRRETADRLAQNVVVKLLAVAPMILAEILQISDRFHVFAQRKESSPRY